MINSKMKRSSINTDIWIVTFPSFSKNDRKRSCLFKPCDFGTLDTRFLVLQEPAYQGTVDTVHVKDTTVPAFCELHHPSTRNLLHHLEAQHSLLPHGDYVST